jgi:diguanylate cyclase (GGDEF)-like protein
MDMLDAEHRRSQRYSHSFGLLMIDLDHFKHINDQFGHPCGDMVLKEVASVLQAEVRSSDLVGRYGGEEISILLPETDILSARQVAEKLRRAIESHVFDYQGTSVDVTASIGVSACQSGDGQSWQALLNQADEALYRAKESGRNRVG